MKTSLLTIIAVFILAGLAEARTITVGKSGSYDFNSVRAAVNDANNGDTVIVYPGFYDEYIDFAGKNITVKSTNPYDPNVVESTIINWKVYFKGTEDANCTFSGFKTSGIYGTYTYDQKHTHATISYCIISGNPLFDGYAIRACDGIISNCLIVDIISEHHAIISECHGFLKNCTIVHNGIWCGIFVGEGGTTTIENCIIYYNIGAQIEVADGGTLNVSYSCIQNGIHGISAENNTVNWGEGNIDNDPCFVRVGDFYYDIFGDYRLKSEGWRWDANREVWTWDNVTSRCIDAGNPGTPLGYEPLTIPADPQNKWGINKRIDMGFYGGTLEASMPPYDWAYLADLNNDGIVNFTDYGLLANNWLSSQEEQSSDLNRDGLIGFSDVALLAEDWLKCTSYWKTIPPVVRIINPKDGDTIIKNTPVEFEADAWDPDGEVVKVEFFDGGVKIDEDNDGSDGWLIVTNLSDGFLTVRATDNMGASTVSKIVIVHIVYP
jgi:hypothetical protein